MDSGLNPDSCADINRLRLLIQHEHNLHLLDFKKALFTKNFKENIIKHIKLFTKQKRSIRFPSL